MTRLYLIRHAQAEGNLYRRMHGWYDSLITDTGYRQIAALTGRFDGVPIDAVYSSPLCRCKTTARAIYVPHHLPLQIEPGLIEIGIGVWEDVPFGDVQVHDPERMRLFGEVSPAYEIEGGETYQQVQERMVEAIFKIADANPGKTVACFSHGMVIRTALSWFHGYGLEGIGKVPHSDNTGVACIEVEGRDVRVLFEADNSHLPMEISTIVRQRGRGEERTVFAMGNANLWFRPWRPYEEKELYFRYRHEAWVDIHGREAFFDGEAFYQAAFRASLEEPKSVMVAYLGEEIVGMIQMDLDRDAKGGVCFVPFVYMNPTHRHKGLGVQLIGQAVSTARPLGRDKLRLRCAPTNQIAKRFYTRNGFRKIGMAQDSQVPLELLEKDIGYPKED
ncbi:MAG: bifunctional histidine phosphatase family protein/GNAT family N-acetyltransferase [Clostridiales bacterium]|nr:bifunctional histidine phosphatase family protein/GNAT family N-acetyltransferase [Clostridiales bacterium]